MLLRVNVKRGGEAILFLDALKCFSTNGLYQQQAVMFAMQKDGISSLGV